MYGSFKFVLHHLLRSVRLSLSSRFQTPTSSAPHKDPPQLSHSSLMMSSNMPMQAKTVHNISQISARTTHTNIGRLRATHPNKAGTRQQHAPAVRRIMPSDKQAWLSLFKNYIAWYKASVPDDIIELTWQRIMAGGEGNHQGFVAEDETGQAGGHSCTENLQCHRHLSFYWCRCRWQNVHCNTNTASLVCRG